MTTKDLERATGIARQTIYNHIQNGWLDARLIGSRWDITPGEAVRWARWCWEFRKIYMYPPETADGFIKHFCIN